MASFHVWLGVFLIGGLLVLGIFQSVQYEDTPTGAALAGAVVLEEPIVVAEAPEPQEQESINICMNGCMRECVVDVSDNDRCRPVCEGFCNVQN